jgi:hypothetical protein
MKRNDVALAQPWSQGLRCPDRGRAAFCAGWVLPLDQGRPCR